MCTSTKVPSARGQTPTTTQHLSSGCCQTTTPHVGRVKCSQIGWWCHTLQAKKFFLTLDIFDSWMLLVRRCPFLNIFGWTLRIRGDLWMDAVSSWRILDGHTAISWRFLNEQHWFLEVCYISLLPLGILALGHPRLLGICALQCTANNISAVPSSFPLHIQLVPHRYTDSCGKGCCAKRGGVCILNPLDPPSAVDFERGGGSQTPTWCPSSEKLTPPMRDTTMNVVVKLLPGSI